MPRPHRRRRPKNINLILFVTLALLTGAFFSIGPRLYRAAKIPPETAVQAHVAVLTNGLSVENRNGRDWTDADIFIDDTYQKNLSWLALSSTTVIPFSEFKHGSGSFDPGTNSLTNISIRIKELAPFTMKVETSK